MTAVSLSLTPDTAEAARTLATVRDFLRYAVSRFNQAGLVHGHGAFSAYDEAAFLILEALHLPVDQLEPYLDARLLPNERLHLADLVYQRVTTRKPAAYLVRRAYMQGVAFYVDERTIVPRSFIGELLFSGLFSGQGEGLSLIDNPDAVSSALDLCTGSACLAILAARAFPSAAIDAVDLSPDALAVAAINVAEHGLEDRVNLLEGDLFAPLGKRRYDLIISNPPYVDAEAMDGLPPEYQAEPRMALVGGDTDGMAIVRRILEGAARYLTPQGGLLLEVGTGRTALERLYPDTEFLWLETETSFGEVLWLSKRQLTSLVAQTQQ
jgi:ribosomal protein L3 glutamine methyltransferase